MNSRIRFRLRTTPRAARSRRAGCSPRRRPRSRTFLSRGRAPAGRPPAAARRTWKLRDYLRINNKELLQVVTGPTDVLGCEQPRVDVAVHAEAGVVRGGVVAAATVAEQVQHRRIAARRGLVSTQPLKRLYTTDFTAGSTAENLIILQEFTRSGRGPHVILTGSTASSTLRHADESASITASAAARRPGTAPAPAPALELGKPDKPDKLESFDFESQAPPQDMVSSARWSLRCSAGRQHCINTAATLGQQAAATHDQPATTCAARQLQVLTR